jgi:hypothetical protein
MDKKERTKEGKRNMNKKKSALRRGSAADHLLELQVRIPPGGMDICFF